jgi:hypothetical protein
MNEVQRLVNLLFWAPGAAFADIVRKPRWWVPMILVIAAYLAFTSMAANRIGWEEIIRDGMARSSRTQDMSAADIDRAVQQQLKFVPIMSYAGGVVGVPIAVLVMAAAITLFFSVFMGANARFGKVFGVISYAQLPGLLMMALATVVLHIKAPEDFDMQNALPLNVGFYMPDTVPRWLTSMLSSIDLPTFWVMALMIIGLRAIDPKATRGKAMAAVFLPWGIWVLGKTALAAVF